MGVAQDSDQCKPAQAPAEAVKSHEPTADDNHEKNVLQEKIDVIFAEFRAKLSSTLDERSVRHTTSDLGNNNGGTSEFRCRANSYAIDKRSRKFTGKQFKARDSVLTELFRVNHIRTIYHIFVAMLALLFVHSLLHDFVEQGSINFGMELVVFAMGKVRESLELWLTMFLSVVMFVYPSFHFWAHHRASSPVAMDTLFACIFVVYLLALLVLPPIQVVAVQLPPASAMAVMLEQIRLTMKVYAFVRTNLPRARCHTTLPSPGLQASSSSHSETAPHSLSRSRSSPPSQSSNTTSAAELQAPCPDFNKFMYFLFAPTLVYRDSYPRTSRVRWRVVVWQLMQVVGAVIYTNFLLRRFVLAPFTQLGVRAMSSNQLMVHVISLVMPAMFCYLTGFFALLHAWMNAFAEMTRFADRLFYRDWWNCTNFAGFYRTWNIVVHDWLYEYIYLDLMGTCGKLAATLAVFAVSAVVHEYVLMVIFGFFFPLLFLQFGFFGTLMYFLNLRNSSGNILLWLMLSLGNALNFCFYTAEWYARTNCPAVHEDIFLNFLSSRAWTCTVANSTMA